MVKTEVKQKNNAHQRKNLRWALTVSQQFDLWFMDFCVVTAYPLFAVLHKRIGEASRLDLFEQGVGVRLDGERTELDTIILLRCGR